MKRQDVSSDWKESKYDKLHRVLGSYYGSLSPEVRRAVAYVCFSSPYPLTSDYLKNEIETLAKNLRSMQSVISLPIRTEKTDLAKKDAAWTKSLLKVYRDIIKIRLFFVKRNVDVTYTEILTVLRDVEAL